MSFTLHSLLKWSSDPHREHLLDPFGHSVFQCPISPQVKQLLSLLVLENCTVFVAFSPHKGGGCPLPPRSHHHTSLLLPVSLVSLLSTLGDGGLAVATSPRLIDYAPEGVTVSSNWTPAHDFSGATPDIQAQKSLKGRSSPVFSLVRH